MNYGVSGRYRSIAAAAAFAVTAMLASSLVESFDPAQLQKIEAKPAAEQVAWPGEGGSRRIRPNGRPISRRA